MSDVVEDEPLLADMYLALSSYVLDDLGDQSLLRGAISFC